ncbi:putative membrane protein [Geoglobus ahangari]|uniref:Putative membrane protein n=2 Tax=Geoglobus ahangari TaxID=113653 RepID=A0A0F7IES3_9EURY|nr:putative membrane protein [Geoglobus ahangari]
MLVLTSIVFFASGVIIGSCNLFEFENKIEPVQDFNINNFKLSFSNILRNNLHVLLLLIGGSFFAGVPTFFGLLINGIPLGIIIRLGRVALFLTLPHSILEIPAIITAGAAGFKIPYEIIRYLVGRKEQVLTREDVKEYLTLALISVVLIVIAAWIEANVTLKIAEHFLSK